MIFLNRAFTIIILLIASHLSFSQEQSNWVGKIGKEAAEEERLILKDLNVRKISVLRSDGHKNPNYVLEEFLLLDKEGRVTEDRLSDDFYGEWEGYIKTENTYDDIGRIKEIKSYSIENKNNVSGENLIKPLKLELDNIDKFEYESNETTKPKTLKRYFYQNGNLLNVEEEEITEFKETNIEYIYDNKNRLTEIKRFEEGTHKYGYVEIFQYDDKDRITTEECPIDEYSEKGSPNIVKYIYGDNGLLSQEKAFWKSGEIDYDKIIEYEFYP